MRTRRKKTKIEKRWSSRKRKRRVSLICRCKVRNTRPAERARMMITITMERQRGGRGTRGQTLKKTIGGKERRSRRRSQRKLHHRSSPPRHTHWKMGSLSGSTLHRLELTSRNLRKFEQQKQQSHLFWNVLWPVPKTLYCACTSVAV